METFIVSGYYEIYPPPHGIGHLEPFSFRIAATTHDEAKRTAETQLAGEVAGWEFAPSLSLHWSGSCSEGAET